jgi:hypothetical protein
VPAPVGQVLHRPIETAELIRTRLHHLLVLQLAPYCAIRVRDATAGPNLCSPDRLGIFAPLIRYRTPGFESLLLPSNHDTKRQHTYSSMILNLDERQVRFMNSVHLEKRPDIKVRLANS